MTKKQDEFTNIPLNLSDVIKKSTKKNVSFLELNEDNRLKVLSYIQKNQLDLKIFEEKWYDVVSHKFYTTEYTLSNNLLYLTTETKEFLSFDEFYNYVKGDIYDNTCLYGYVFSKEEISKYLIQLDKINFDSFVKETIDSYTFETLTSFYHQKNYAKQMFEWINNLDPITNITDYENKHNEFVDMFQIWGAGRIFFSFLIRKDLNIIKNAIIDYACKGTEIVFEDILFFYGREAALQVLNNYHESCSYTTFRKRIRAFNDTLSRFDNGTLVTKKSSGFDNNLQLYYVDIRYYNNNFKYTRYYFYSFDEFVLFLNQDLSGVDLSKANISSNEILKYKTDEKTKFPNQYHNNYVILKKYEKDNFIVIQKWLDGNNLVLEKEHTFNKFFDFVHFLKCDLSNTDFLNFEKLDNIIGLSNLNFTGILVRSEVAKKLKIGIVPLPKKFFVIQDFESTKQNEKETTKQLLITHPDNQDYSFNISYITDIHLIHRLNAYKCVTSSDVIYTLREMASIFGSNPTTITLIGGDTSSDLELFEKFVINISEYDKYGDYFFVLGNHELWPLCEYSLETITEKYKTILDKYGQGRMHLINNSLFYYSCATWKEIDENTLSIINKDKLRSLMRDADIIIFGGIGFAGKNEEFNANNGIYLTALNRIQEIKESEKFLSLYNKVINALYDKNLVVLTHMPIKDWGGDIKTQKGVVYVNGHNHRNFFCDDGEKRIFADNQIGYKGKHISLKQIPMEFGYDWFADYKDGIYEISKSEYIEFYRGFGERISFNREFEKIYMLKREMTYMFLLKKIDGKMLILNGGSVRKCGNHSLDYYYNNLNKYSNSIKLFLSNYDSYQKQIASEIKKIGGDGTIHGSIVDIDFLNHLYINPLDGKITPYFAYSITDKYIYNNIQSLLKYECPTLFSNYKSIYGKNNANNELVLWKDNNISKNTIFVPETDMYRISRILKGLQFTTKYNIVRLWNDTIIDKESSETGRLLVSGIINPESIVKIESEQKTTKEPKIKETKPKIIKEKVIKEKISPEEIYKKKLYDLTNGTIDLIEYNGAKGKAKYKCTMCGYTWELRPDHFKERQQCKCPKCKNIKQN